MNRPVTPQLAVDIIIELIDRKERPILLIERKNPPPGWAIPGGFVDSGETVEQAAVREAKEETSLDVELKILLGCYSNPARDVRGHTVTLVYVAESVGAPRAQDDARDIKVVGIKQLPGNLAFDHDLVLQDYVNYRERGQLTPLR
jgi:8-oxo-dGTP diphosphatase